MRLWPFLPIAALLMNLPVRAQNVEQSLSWARQAIDEHAVTQHLEPPARSSGVKWQVDKIDGCTVELKETDHRESADSIVNGSGVFDLNEDKVVTWTFNLGDLRPQFVMADTSAGTPHIKIFAEGDAFHTKTQTVSRAIRKDGTPETTQTWSAAANQRNLWMFFDSPDTDNKFLVRRVERALRDAVKQCVVRASR